MIAQAGPGPPRLMTKGTSQIRQAAKKASRPLRAVSLGAPLGSAQNSATASGTIASCGRTPIVSPARVNPATNEPRASSHTAALANASPGTSLSAIPELSQNSGITANGSAATGAPNREPTPHNASTQTVPHTALSSVSAS